jgi:hypothetical protein
LKLKLGRFVKKNKVGLRLKILGFALENPPSLSFMGFNFYQLRTRKKNLIIYKGGGKSNKIALPTPLFSFPPPSFP